MRECKMHWQMMKDAIEEHGLGSLISHSSQDAMEGELKQLEEFARSGKVSDKTLVETFDPLMSMHWHFSNDALRCGGLYIITVDKQINPDNDGHYCPLCEFVKHSTGFNDKEAVTSVVKQMRAYAVENKLITGLQ